MDTKQHCDNSSRTAVQLLFVTNFCSHYRVGAFEELSSRVPTEFIFFSNASEGYWEKKNPVGGARINEETVLGLRVLPKFRVPVRLLWELLKRKYDVVVKCMNGRSELPIAFLISKLRRKKFVLWQTIWYHPQTLAHRLSLPFLRAIWRGSDAIVVYGQHGKDYLVREGVQPEKIFVAFQAVDNSLYGRAVDEDEVRQVRRQLGLANRKIILYVGQLIPVKGLDYLLEAYRLIRSPDSCLVLIGRGPEESRLRSQVRDLPDVVFAGYVPPSGLAPYYAAASAFVLPSVTLREVKEAWGLVVNEAMNQSCPAVVSDSVGAGVGGLVRDGQNGFVVPERDARALADALARILSDPLLEAALRSEAKRTVREFTYQRWADGFTDAIQFSMGS